MVLSIMVVLDTLFVLGILLLGGFSPDMLFFLAIVGIFLKLLAILGLILFFSTFVSPAIALFMTIASYMIGHSGYVMLNYAITNADTVFLQLARFILALFPNLESLNLKNYVATDAVIDYKLTLIAFAIAIAYIGIITFLAAKIFEKRSFDAV